MRLNQIRFRDGPATLDDDALRALHASEPLVDCDPVIDVWPHVSKPMLGEETGTYIWLIVFLHSEKAR